MRALPGGRDDVLLIPLPGHSRGHCGVAVRTCEGWLLHCGDAYFHHAEVAPQGGRAPLGLRLFESLVNVDRKARLANQARLRALANDHGQRGQARLLARSGGPYGVPKLSRRDAQSPPALPRSALIAPRRLFSSSRRVFEASVGLVGRRGFSRCCAFDQRGETRARVLAVARLARESAARR